jgi:hypothetical protein
MPKYYHYDISRWEGEGGSHGELIPPPHPIRHTNESVHPRNRNQRRTPCTAPSARASSSHLRRCGREASCVVRGKRD